ncbi:MAG: hypothetical protein ACREQV_00030 [Candidatus Binatia bacterium]
MASPLCDEEWSLIGVQFEGPEDRWDAAACASRSGLRRYRRVSGPDSITIWLVGTLDRSRQRWARVDITWSAR